LCLLFLSSASYGEVKSKYIKSSNLKPKKETVYEKRNKQGKHSISSLSTYSSFKKVAGKVGNYVIVEKSNGTFKVVKKSVGE